MGRFAIEAGLRPEQAEDRGLHDYSFPMETPKRRYRAAMCNSGSFAQDNRYIRDDESSVSGECCTMQGGSWMDTTVMTTERLNLRKMTKEDVKNLLQIFSDPEAMKYYPSIMNEEEALGWITRTLGNYEKLGVGFWIVEDKSTGKFLGQCGIIPQELNGTNVMEIPYLFVRQEWGNGYATESAMNMHGYTSWLRNSSDAIGQKS